MSADTCATESSFAPAAVVTKGPSEADRSRPTRGFNSRRYRSSDALQRSLIELTIDEPEQLFHALDPSPRAGRDLDKEVEEFILDSALENPGSSYSMLLHIPAVHLGSDGNALADSIRTYFAKRRDEVARRLRTLMREGRQALAIGLAFLFICGILGAVAQKTVPAPIGSFLNEGLLIIGWVANWRPVEIFLYDWRPLRKQRDLLGALARMPIDFRPTST